MVCGGNAGAEILFGVEGGRHNEAHVVAGSAYHNHPLCNRLFKRDPCASAEIQTSPGNHNDITILLDGMVDCGWEIVLKNMHDRSNGPDVDQGGVWR